MSRAAIIQMVSSSKVEENLSQATKLLKQAKEKDAALVLLPENFAFMGFNEFDKMNVAEVHGQGLIQDRISQLARELNLWIIAGTIPLKTSGTRVRAASLVYDNKGCEAARYDKIHLFDVRISEKEAHQESVTIERGDMLSLVDTPVGRVGLAVCYDLRFAELFHRLMNNGAELFALPSAFTETTGQAHWESLLRARAIENLSYVLAANQGGVHENGRTTYGHSMMVEPWGSIIAEQKEFGAGVLTADIDLARLRHLRKQFPSIEHHVLD